MFGLALALIGRSRSSNQKHRGGRQRPFQEPAAWAEFPSAPHVHTQPFKTREWFKCLPVDAKRGDKVLSPLEGASGSPAAA